MEQNYSYTKIPNVILDNLPSYTPIECKVMMLIARQTMGYADAIHEFSVKYICQKIGHKKIATRKAVNGLLNKNFIVNINTGERGVRSFTLAEKMGSKVTQTKESTGSQMNPDPGHK